MRSLLLSLLVAAATVGSARAGTISISITQSTRLDDGNLIADVKVSNSGDEAALSVTPILQFGDKAVRGTGIPSLGPNASHQETLTVPVGTLGEGRWPYRIAVDYTDQNQYPFQALFAQALVVGSPPAAKVAVPAITNTDIAGSGTLSVTVKNLAADPRTTRVNVLVPEGLEATSCVPDGGARGLEGCDAQGAGREPDGAGRQPLSGVRHRGVRRRRRALMPWCRRASWR